MPTLHYTDVDLIMGINYPVNKQAGTFYFANLHCLISLDWLHQKLKRYVHSL